MPPVIDCLEGREQIDYWLNMAMNESLMEEFDSK